MKRILTCSTILAICGLTTGSAITTLAQTPAATGNINNTRTTESQTPLELRRSLPLPAMLATDASNSVAISNDGKVGFFSAALGESVYAFDLSNGQLLSSIRTGTRAAKLTLFDDGKRRLLAVVNLNEKGESAAVSVLDAADARHLMPVSAFILPPEVSLSHSINPVFTRDGANLLIASDSPGALFLFSSATGELLDRAELAGGIDSLSIVHRQEGTLIGAVSAGARTVSIFQLTQLPALQFQSSFELPTGFGLVPANNLSFNRAGTIGYLASFEGNQLFSFDLVTGFRIDNFEVGDAPAAVAWSEHNGKTRIAVVNTGLKHGFLANSVSIIEAGEDGRFGAATVFLPPDGSDLSPDSNVTFTRDGRAGLVAAFNGQLFMFDAENGEQLASSRLVGQATRFAIDERSRRAVAITSTTTADRLALFKVNSKQLSPALPGITPTIIDKSSLPATQSVPVAKPDTKALAEEDKVKPANRPEINRVRAYRIRRGLRIMVDGVGFQPGSEIVVNERSLPTTRTGDNRLTARLSWGFIGRARSLQVAAKNPDGSATAEVKKYLRRRH